MAWRFITTGIGTVYATNEDGRRVATILVNERNITVTFPDLKGLDAKFDTIGEAKAYVHGIDRVGRVYRMEVLESAR
jgi:hypothetical protein